MADLTVEVNAPLPRRPSLGACEKALFKAGFDAGRKLLCRAFALIEDDASSPKALVTK